MEENRKNADLFAHWYINNKQHLKDLILRSYPFDEDVLSEVFLSIYNRILYKQIAIKDYTPYMLMAFRYKYLTQKKKSDRLILIENYNLLFNISSL